MDTALWLLNVADATPATLAAAESRLASDARPRLQRITRAAVRDRFVLSRTLLRHAAAEHVGCTPERIGIAERDDDAPRVSRDDGRELHVSLSHSGDWVACAVSAHAPLGLDIEDMRKPRDVAAISAWAFHAPEHDWVLRQPNHTSAFYRLWTGKEAIYKLAHRLGQAPLMLRIEFDVQGDTLVAPPPAARLSHLVVYPLLACTVAGSQPDSRPLEPATLRRLGATGLAALLTR